MDEMFCFQCQQTAHNEKCNGKAGVCGKKSDTAKAQDELIGALIGLAKAAECGTPTDSTDRLVLKGLFTTITNVSFNTKTVNELTAQVEEEKRKICKSKVDNYDLSRLWEASDDIRSLKSLILFGIKGMAAYAYHALALGKTDSEVNSFFYTAPTQFFKSRLPVSASEFPYLSGQSRAKAIRTSC